MHHPGICSVGEGVALPELPGGLEVDLSGLAKIGEGESQCS